MWRKPTTDDLRGAILEDEMLVWQDVSVKDGLDVTAQAIANAVGVFRTALRSGYTGIMGGAGTLPDDLIPNAMHIAVYYLLGGRGGARVSETRRQLYLDALDMSKRIADGRLAYADPDDPEAGGQPSDKWQTPVFRRKTITLSRERQEGV